jgi:acyl-coenzyme A synthetase/AMP-(fatty) acid ligase
VVRGVDQRELAAAVRAQSPDLEHVLTVRADPAPGQRALETLEDDPSAPLAPSPLGAHDVAMLFYTSGTTADPKGVLHTPSTLGAVLHYQAQMFAPAPDDRSSCSSAHHIGGLAAFVLQPIVGAEHGLHGSVRPRAGDRSDRALRRDQRRGPPATLQGMSAAPNHALAKLRTLRTSAPARRRRPS